MEFATAATGAAGVAKPQGCSLRKDEQESRFLAWLNEHRSSVWKVARAYSVTDEECQDLAQEILLQAWRSFPSFQHRSSAATWCYRVALQTAMNWRRRDQPRRAKQQPLLLPDNSMACDNSAAVEQVQQRDTVEQLYRAIQRLPKADAALVLLYLDELSYQQMAEILGISVSNVGVKLNRAKKSLAALMNGQSHDS